MNAPNPLFWTNSDVLVRFGQFHYCAKNHAGVAFDAPIRTVNKTRQSFGPEMKRTQPIHYFKSNSDVLVHFGQFRYGAKNHAGFAFNAPIRAGTETMLRFGPETKRTHPIHCFGPNSDVLVRFGQFHYCAKNHAGVAFDAPIRTVNKTRQSFGPEMKRTQPIHYFKSNSDVLVHFGQFRYGAKSHAGVAFNAPIRAGTETMLRFGPKTKRTHPIPCFGPNSDVLVRIGQFCYCARNHAGVAFDAPIRAVNKMRHSFGPEMKRTQPIHYFKSSSDVLV